MIEIRNLFHEGGSPADLRYKEEERKRPREIAEKTARVLKCFLLHLCTCTATKSSELLNDDSSSSLPTGKICFLCVSVVCWYWVTRFLVIKQVYNIVELYWCTDTIVIAVSIVAGIIVIVIGVVIVARMFFRWELSYLVWPHRRAYCPVRPRG